MRPRRGLTRDLILAAVLTLPVFVLERGGHMVRVLAGKRRR